MGRVYSALVHKRGLRRGRVARECPGYRVYSALVHNRGLRRGREARECPGYRVLKVSNYCMCLLKVGGSTLVLERLLG